MPDVVLISTALADRKGTGGRLNTTAARTRLEGVRDELDRSIAVLNGAQPEHPLASDYPSDPADSGTNLAESDRAQAILTAAKARRVLVTEALGRLDAGTYGRCVDCGKSVPDGRLEAKPEAARCVACQAKRDRLRR